MLENIGNRINTLVAPKQLIIFAFLLRVILVVYGEIQDQYFQVKYSDVDYFVVTDSSRLVYIEHESPYKRHTYRYSPLLSYLLIPNVAIHRSIGKFIFVGFDMIAAYLMYLLVLSKNGNHQLALWACIGLLYNPLSMAISTRGSGDSIICVLVLFTLLGLIKSNENSWEWLILSALAHGISVHWRLYPIIFAPSILLYLKDWPKRIVFGLISGGIFFLLGILFFWLYGMPFLQETFLYHLSRTDHRHNFSIWFYPLYLGLRENVGPLLSLGAFLPQIMTQAALVRKFASKDIVFSFFLQTWAFVVFNKVVTAQYFLWYASLLPVALLSVNIPGTRMLLFYAVAWIISELHWLFWGYQIEFVGLSVFEGVHMAGLIFFIVNITIINGLIQSHVIISDGRMKKTN
jgi:phosphatidylinositol glycan class M